MSMSKKKLQTFNGEINIDRIIRVLETERECVSRDCDRDCGKCDLAQDRDWLLSVYDAAISLLKEQEAKTGKWILDDEDANSWECSECGGLLIINDGTPHENDWYFCPYCGSKLEGQAVKWDD